MDYGMFNELITTKNNWMINKLTATRPQEITIIALLVITIGIGIAILIQIKKLKDRL